MKINAIVKCLLIFILLSLNAKAQSINWIGQYGSKNFDKALNTCIDDSGNIYVTGQFRDTLIFANDTLPCVPQDVSGDNQYIIKYSPAGVRLWAKSIQLNYDKSAVTSIAVDHNGYFYFTGYFMDTLTIGNFQITSPGQYEMFICKGSPSGNFLWLKSTHTISTFNRTIYGIDLTSDHSNNILLLFRYDHTTSFDSVTFLSNNNTQAGVIKLDSGGNVLWTNHFFQDSLTWAGSIDGNNIAVDTLDNIYVCGTFQGSVLYGNQSLFMTNVSVFTAKLDPSGIIQWMKGFGCPAGLVRLEDFDVSTMGETAITGSFSTELVFSDTTLTFPNSTFPKAYLISYNSNGILRLVKPIGNSWGADGQQISYDESGNIYLLIQGHDLMSIDTFTVNMSNYCLIKYSTNGIAEWIKLFPGWFYINDLKCNWSDEAILSCDFTVSYLVFDGIPLVLPNNDPGNCCIINLNTTTTVNINTIDSDDFSVYPTISAGKITVNSPDFIKQFYLTDVNGKIIHSVRNYFPDQFNLDFSSQGLKGMYVLTLVTERGMISKMLTFY
jgi:hypothetical protein